MTRRHSADPGLISGEGEVRAILQAAVSLCASPHPSWVRSAAGGVRCRRGARERAIFISAQRERQTASGCRARRNAPRSLREEFGHPVEAIAARLGASEAPVRRWSKEPDSRGTAKALHRGARRHAGLHRPSQEGHTSCANAGKATPHLRCSPRSAS